MSSIQGSRLCGKGEHEKHRFVSTYALQLRCTIKADIFSILNYLVNSSVIKIIKFPRLF